MIVKVECYAGYRGDERPRRFFLGERVVEVEEVLDQWVVPDHSYFKVLANDGAIYILRRDVAAGHWELWMYDKGRPPLDRSFAASPGSVAITRGRPRKLVIDS